MIDLQTRVDLIDPATEFAPGEKIACTSYDATCFGNKFGDPCDGICASMCGSNTANWKAGNSTKNDDPDRDSWNSKNKWGGLVKTFFGDVIGDLSQTLRYCSFDSERQNQRGEEQQFQRMYYCQLRDGRLSVGTLQSLQGANKPIMSIAKPAISDAVGFWQIPITWN